MACPSASCLDTCACVQPTFCYQAVMDIIIIVKFMFSHSQASSHMLAPSLLLFVQVQGCQVIQQLL